MIEPTIYKTQSFEFTLREGNERQFNFNITFNCPSGIELDVREIRKLLLEHFESISWEEIFPRLDASLSMFADWVCEGLFSMYHRGVTVKITRVEYMDSPHEGVSVTYGIPQKEFDGRLD